MFFEFLVEDKSGEIALEAILSTLGLEPISYEIKAYGGIGRLPKDLKPGKNPKGRALLNKLPQLLKGLGRLPGAALRGDRRRGFRRSR